MQPAKPVQHHDNPGFNCVDCDFDTFYGEYYMVRDSVWRRAKMKSHYNAGMLCIGCLQNRLRRKLTHRDFTPAPINSIFPDSMRLAEAKAR